MMSTRISRGHSAGFLWQGHSNAPRPLTREQRRRIEALVVFLIEPLDTEDGDPDLEPSLGWSRTYAITPHDKSPATVDLEEDEAEREPWIVPARLDGTPSTFAAGEPAGVCPVPR